MSPATSVSGPGMNAGSRTTRMGPATRLMPNPTEPWTTAPTSTTIAATSHATSLISDRRCDRTRPAMREPVRSPKCRDSVVGVADLVRRLLLVCQAVGESGVECSPIQILVGLE